MDCYSLGVSNFYYTYVLRCVDNNLYIGFSHNLQKRLEKHVKGFVLATKDRRPVKLVYYEACSDKVKALEREQYFKTGYGRGFLKRRI